MSFLITELETALDDLKYKMEELEIEKEALKEREQVQGSHLELLAKENSDLQREARNLADKNNGIYAVQIAFWYYKQNERVHGRRLGLLITCSRHERCIGCRYSSRYLLSKAKWLVKI